VTESNSSGVFDDPLVAVPDGEQAEVKRSKMKAQIVKTELLAKTLILSISCKKISGLQI
jgi:hypothetical protein